MKILVVDNDDVTVNLLKSKIEASGHQFFSETAKNKAVDRVKADAFDVIFIDPSPLTTPRPIILNIKRSVSSYPYIFLLSESFNPEDAILAGANDLFAKPIDSVSLGEKLKNAVNLKALVANYGDDSLDFPSAGGVIAKSAFNQLFLSAIDRADRYGERTYVLKISINNHKDVLDMDGPYALDFAAAKLSQKLVLLRRQSDIIGQTGKYEFTLLLQRPIYETEPVEAANRFGEALSKVEEIAAPGTNTLDLRVGLYEIPTGKIIVEHLLKSEQAA